MPMSLPVYDWMLLTSIIDLFFFIAFCFFSFIFVVFCMGKRSKYLKYLVYQLKKSKYRLHELYYQSIANDEKGGGVVPSSSSTAAAALYQLNYRPTSLAFSSDTGESGNESNIANRRGRSLSGASSSSAVVAAVSRSSASDNVGSRALSVLSVGSAASIAAAAYEPSSSSPSSQELKEGGMQQFLHNNWTTTSIRFSLALEMYEVRIICGLCICSVLTEAFSFFMEFYVYQFAVLPYKLDHVLGWRIADATGGLSEFLLSNLLPLTLGIFLLKKAVKCDFLHYIPVKVWSTINVVFMFLSVLAWLLEDGSKTIYLLAHFKESIDYDPYDQRSTWFVISSILMLSMSGLSILNAAAAVVIALLSYARQPKSYFEEMDSAVTPTTALAITTQVASASGIANASPIDLSMSGSYYSPSSPSTDKQREEHLNKYTLLLLLHDYYVYGLFWISWLSLACIVFATMNLGVNIIDYFFRKSFEPVLDQTTVAFIIDAFYSTSVLVLFSLISVSMWWNIQGADVHRAKRKFEEERQRKQQELATAAAAKKIVSEMAANSGIYSSMSPYAPYPKKKKYGTFKSTSQEIAGDYEDDEEHADIQEGSSPLLVDESSALQGEENSGKNKKLRRKKSMSLKKKKGKDPRMHRNLSGYELQDDDDDFDEYAASFSNSYVQKMILDDNFMANALRRKK